MQLLEQGSELYTYFCDTLGVTSDTLIQQCCHLLRKKYITPARLQHEMSIIIGDERAAKLIQHFNSLQKQ